MSVLHGSCLLGLKSNDLFFGPRRLLYACAAMSWGGIRFCLFLTCILARFGCATLPEAATRSSELFVGFRLS